MTTDTSFQWLGGKPPGPQSAQAGSCWRFILPLIGTGDLPVCRYSSDLFNRCAPDSQAGNLELILNLPPDIGPGIFTVRYSVEANPAIDGQFLLKILPEKPDSDTPDILGKIVQSNGLAIPKASAGPITGQTNRNAYGLQKAYQITVRREDILLPQLHRRVEKHKSLLVGRLSVSKGILPDIDLTAHFASGEDAQRCSRRQVKVFCMGAHIVIENIGKGEISGPDGQILKTGDSHKDWLAGEQFCLPGGINLTLEEVI